MKLHLELAAKDESSQVLLRSRLRAVTRRLGLSEIARERMELVCNEMLTNQAKFARGTGLLQLWEIEQPQPALDLYALDFGPGVADLASAVEDGYTTAGTMGRGLGAIRRLAHESEIYSLHEDRPSDSGWHGVAMWARFYTQGSAESAGQRYGRYSRAYHDNPVSGDLLAVLDLGVRTRWLHLDGLGHGREAYDTVRGVDELLDEHAPLMAILERVSERLRGGRGAVGLVGEVDLDQGRANVCGVGDMSITQILNGERKSVSFAPGILGHAHRHVEELSLSLPSHALLISASDGLRRNWGLQSFPNLWRLAPPMIAFTLGHLIGRSNDDRSLLVIGGKH